MKKYFCNLIACLSIMFVAFFILDLKNFLSTAAAHFRLYTAPQAVIIKILKQLIIKKLKKGQIQNIGRCDRIPLYK